MPRFRSLILVCLVGLASLTAAAAAQSPEEAAQAAAQAWLSRVDGGDYPGSWDQAARVLKAAMPRTEWTKELGASRSPLGKVVSRKLKSREYTEKAPTTRVVGGKVYTWGAGRYVVLEFDTTFANKPAAVETVIPMAEPDGAWRVSAYSVR